MLRQEKIATNGITLNVALDGPSDGPLVLLLHGFPELWYGWRKQLPVLVDRGFQVAAPDQRGYNDSDKPPHVRDYVLDELAKDALGIMDALGQQKAVVIGHDWGAAVAWWLAIRHPDRVERLVVIDVPHPIVMRKFLFTDPEQMKKSWYMFFFQLPKIPELLLSRNDFEKLAEGVFGTAKPGAFAPQDVEIYKTAWRKPGAMTAMIGWYRAIRSQLLQQPSKDELRVKMPALVIWGKDDVLLSPEMAAASVGYCDHGRLAVIENATHWVHHEEPERVNALILEHLGR